jgi:hypothetical protein
VRLGGLTARVELVDGAGDVVRTDGVTFASVDADAGARPAAEVRYPQPVIGVTAVRVVALTAQVSDPGFAELQACTF